jgi:Holliday junction resolvase
MAILESDIQAKIVKQLKLKGWDVLRLKCMNEAGWPDLLALKDKQIMFIEVKRPWQLPTKLQEHKINELRNKGYTVLVMDKQFEK